MKECAIGIRVHSGWGALVAVAGDPGAPEVIERRRVEIIDRKKPGAMQPYHFARDLERVAAEEFISQSAAASSKLAAIAISEIADHLRARKVCAGAILLGSWNPLPPLEKILASHAMIHTAEGQFFRKCFGEAYATLHIPIYGIREAELDERAKAVLGKHYGHVKKAIAGMGKTLGPPWTTDQKAAALAAAIVLAAERY